MVRGTLWTNLCPAVADTDSRFTMKGANYFNNRFRFQSCPKAEEESKPRRRFEVLNDMSYRPFGTRGEQTPGAGRILEGLGLESKTVGCLENSQGGTGSDYQKS